MLKFHHDVVLKIQFTILKFMSIKNRTKIVLLFCLLQWSGILPTDILVRLRRPGLSMWCPSSHWLHWSPSAESATVEHLLGNSAGANGW